MVGAESSQSGLRQEGNGMPSCTGYTSGQWAPDQGLHQAGHKNSKYSPIQILQRGRVDLEGDGVDGGSVSGGMTVRGVFRVVDWRAEEG